MLVILQQLYTGVEWFKIMAFFIFCFLGFRGMEDLLSVFWLFLLWVVLPSLVKHPRLQMRLLWSEVITTGMRPQFVVSMDSCLYQLAGLFKTNGAAVEIKLSFDNAIDPLCQRILVGISVLSHADGNVVAGQQVHIFPGAVLCPSVGMVNKGVCRIASGCQCHLQGSHTTIG